LIKVYPTIVQLTMTSADKEDDCHSATAVFTEASRTQTHPHVSPAPRDRYMRPTYLK
jgi:hypothetical protein